MSAETYDLNYEHQRRQQLKSLARKAVRDAGIEMPESLVDDIEKILDYDGEGDELLDEGWSDSRLRIARRLAAAYVRLEAGEPLESVTDTEFGAVEILQSDDEHAHRDAALANARVQVNHKETTPSINSVRQYFNEIGKKQLINAAQEVELAKRIEAGVYAAHLLKEVRYEAETGEVAYAGMSQEQVRDLLRVERDGNSAKNEMLEANLRLVVSLAKRYTGKGMSFQDLIQEGNLGLIRAMEKFDFKKGYKFSTYATWWIRQAITRGIADHARTIRLPVHQVETINKISRIKRELTQNLGRDPTIQEVAKESGISAKKLIEIADLSREPISLNAPVGDDDGAEYGDFIEDRTSHDVVDTVASNGLREQLNEVLETLTPREAGIIRMRFGFDGGKPKTLDEIGQVYQVTRERIRQIETKTMSKLRHPDKSEVLRDYLE